MVLENAKNGIYSVVLDDVFDFKRVEDFRKCYEQIDMKNCNTVCIDFTHTRYMDSSALGMLLNVKNYFKPINAAVKIVSVNDQIRKILTISRFDQRFVIE